MMGFFKEEHWKMQPMEMIKHLDRRIYGFLLEAINHYLLDFILL